MIQLLGVLVLAAAAQAAPEEGVIKDRKTFLPYRNFPALGGKQVMLLVTEPAAMLQVDGRIGGYGCLTAGGSYVWIKELDSAAKIKEWGVTGKFALAEIEVNGGAGCKAGEFTIRATKVTVLDGTAKFPIKSSEAVARMEKEYAAFLKEKETAIEDGMEKARKDAIQDGRATGPRAESTLLYATWLPEAERLQVRFFTRKLDGAYKSDSGGSQTISPAEARYGPEWGVVFGMSYELDQSGALIKRERLEIDTFKQEKPRPPQLRFPTHPPPPQK